MWTLIPDVWIWCNECDRDSCHRNLELILQGWRMQWNLEGLHLTTKWWWEEQLKKPEFLSHISLQIASLVTSLVGCANQVLSFLQGNKFVCLEMAIKRVSQSMHLQLISSFLGLENIIIKGWNSPYKQFF